MKIYTHGSLFSGIGGAEVAASLMGWNNVFHCEIQPFPRTILDYWFPNAESYEDITKTDFTKWRGKIDILTGGFPCQPFSLAGRRGGAEDDRYLWPQMLRAIREIQPTWIVGENVNGIITMVQPSQDTEVGCGGNLFEESYTIRAEQSFTLEEICQNLEHEGYSVQPIVIPACAVGAPHRRDRVWIIAYRNNNRFGNGESEQEHQQGSVNKAESCSNGAQREMEQYAADTYCNRHHPQQTSERVKEEGGRIHDEQSKCRPTTKRTDGLSTIQRDVNNTECFRRDAESNDDGKSEEAQQAKCRQEQFGRANCSQGGWREGSAKPDVRGRDDGIQPNVDNTTHYGGGKKEITDKPNSNANAEELLQDSITNPCSLGLGECKYGQAQRQGQKLADEGCDWPNFWERFPTQSPICRGNDGFPFGVDDMSISIPQWRKESIKAYGNAWVPQVAYEIFKAISLVEETEPNKKNKKL